MGAAHGAWFDAFELGRSTAMFRGEANPTRSAQCWRVNGGAQAAQLVRAERVKLSGTGVIVRCWIAANLTEQQREHGAPARRCHRGRSLLSLARADWKSDRAGALSPKSAPERPRISACPGSLPAIAIRAPPRRSPPASDDPEQPERRGKEQDIRRRIVRTRHSATAAALVGRVIRWDEAAIGLAARAPVPRVGGRVHARVGCHGVVARVGRR